MSAFNGVTNKQKIFIEEYLKDFNGARAGRVAGYKHPRRSAHENLTKPHIREIIKARFSLIAMDTNEVLWRLGEQGRTNPEDFFEITPRGNAEISLTKAKELGKLHQIKKIKYNARGELELEFYDAQRALELIGKAHGIFKDRVEHSGNKDNPVEVTIREIVVERPSNQ